MRLFVALYPPPEALDDILEQAGRLRIGELSASGVNVRLAARETYHVTLAFLGEVDEDRLGDVHDALGRAAERYRRLRARATRGVTGTVAAPVDETPRLRLGGGGRFGRGRFTVLWVGLQGEIAALRTLSTAIRRELKRARVPYDPRPYRPHLTLARPGDRAAREAIDADRDTLNDYLGPSWPLTEMVLVRSHLGPRPLYHHLGVWPLGTDQTPLSSDG
ncbi:RNA 2',3'-cyclic phosphodiesterase [Micromonospora sonneratiae]|uniref:RNA 2',3'-cyclic phosphodiesterase n=1 Tax=Micromonospora sonneratiae TaxID=1184706 RepID=A0ABW3Y6M1_9ACTN